MAEPSDLVAWLRAFADRHPQFSHGQMAAEAADALAEQAETIERLRSAIQWVVTDAAYKAPEQVNAQMSMHWIERLRSALAADEPASPCPECNLTVGHIASCSKVTWPEPLNCPICHQMPGHHFEWCSRAVVTDPASPVSR